MERKAVPQMSDTPVRKPRLDRGMLTLMAQCMDENGTRITALAEDLQDHLQIADCGVSELTPLLALSAALDYGIHRQRQLNGIDVERALRLLFAEQLLEMED
jgi:hypothetical protein